MKAKYIYILLTCFILSAPAYADDQDKIEKLLDPTPEPEVQYPPEAFTEKGQLQQDAIGQRASLAVDIAQGVPQGLDPMVELPMSAYKEVMRVEFGDDGKDAFNVYKAGDQYLFYQLDAKRKNEGKYAGIVKKKGRVSVALYDWLSKQHVATVHFDKKGNEISRVRNRNVSKPVSNREIDDRLAKLRIAPAN